jgi:hypothetical protein
MSKATRWIVRPSFIVLLDMLFLGLLQDVLLLRLSEVLNVQEGIA